MDSFDPAENLHGRAREVADQLRPLLDHHLEPITRAWFEMLCMQLAEFIETAEQVSRTGPLQRTPTGRLERRPAFVMARNAIENVNRLIEDYLEADHNRSAQEN